MPAYRQVLSLNGIDYPLVSFQIDRIRPLRVQQLATGALRWDEHMGAYEYVINDFSGPLGQMRIEMEQAKQGHRIYSVNSPTWDGSMGYLTGVPQFTNRITPAPAIATTRAIVPTSVCVSSDIEDIGSDPRHYVGVGNEVWRSVKGEPKFQDSGTANAAVSTSNTTLTDTREAWATNEWVGFEVTCGGKTMTVTGNTATVLTGASWSGGGNPGNGLAWEMHDSVVSIPSATQITGFCEASYTKGTSATMIRRIWVTGASATGDHLMKYLGAGAFNDDGAWHTAQRYPVTDIYAESTCVARCWKNPGGTTTGYQDIVWIAHRDGTIDLIAPAFGIGGAYYTPQVFMGSGRVQFLAQRFNDIWGQGVFFITGSELINLYFTEGGLPKSRPIPPLPPLFCGTMYQNMPTVSDGGLQIHQVMGTQTRRLDLPPNLLSECNVRNTAHFRASIRFLASSGDRLLAGLQVTDDTYYSLMLAAYNDAIGQWRILWAHNGGTSVSDFMGTYLGATHAPANLTGADKHLVIVYKVGTNTLVDTIQLPRGLVGQTGADDAFNLASSSNWGLPEFDAGDPMLDGTLFGYRLLLYASQATTPFLAIFDAMDGAAYNEVGANIGPTVGWNAVQRLLGDGQGESFTTCAVVLTVQASTDGTHCPEIHRFSYLFRKRGDCARDYTFQIDVEAWRAKGQTYASLWSNLTTAYEAEPMVAMSVKSEGVATLLSSRYVSVENVEAAPTDPRKPRAVRVLCREML